MRILRSGRWARISCVSVCLAAGAFAAAPGETETFRFGVGWRLLRAGTAVMEVAPGESRVKLDSTGLVSALFKVDDLYTARYDSPMCATSVLLDAHEGKRHRETRVTYDRGQGRASSEMKEMPEGTVVRSSMVETPSCVHDVIGAIQVLRALHIEPGQSAEVPVSDGRRFAQVKVDAQEREQVETPAGKFRTIRYETSLFNGVIYSRKGRAFIWLTDDARRIPVQIKLRLSFPLGTVNLELEPNTEVNP